MKYNNKLNNKAKCVYSTKELFKGFYVSQFEDRDDFKGKYDSHVFKITDFCFDKEFSELILGLEKSNGSSIPYCIVGESEIRQFLADIIGYDIKNLNPIPRMDFERMIGKNIEVFIGSKDVKGICPFWDCNTVNFLDKDCNKEYWKLN